MELTEIIEEIGIKTILKDLKETDVATHRVEIFLNTILQKAKSLEASKNYFESVVNNRSFAETVENS